MDIRELTTIADYFIIASANSERQLTALAEAVQQVGKENGQVVRIEGDAASGWVLADNSDVITHLFSAEKRALYRLEDVWRQAHVLVRLQ